MGKLLIALDAVLGFCLGTILVTLGVTFILTAKSSIPYYVPADRIEVVVFMNVMSGVITICLGGFLSYVLLKGDRRESFTEVSY